MDQMNREQIIAAAKVCFDCYEDGRGRFEYSADEYGLERFAAIIAIAEREECAKACEKIYNEPLGNNGYDAYYTRPYMECAEAIRARGAS